MKETLKCMIVDDEPLAVRLLESFVERTPFLELHSSWLSPAEALEALGPDVDIVFLDVNMPGISGLDLARFVQPPTLVVFTTAFRDYAFDSYSVHAFDYILKPIDYQRFLSSAQRALDHFNADRPASEADQRVPAENPDYMFVKCDYRMVRVDFDSILYIKAMKDYVCIYTVGRKAAVIALATMKALEEKLPRDRFCRVHKSYIVNMRRIDSVERSRIAIADELIPVSDAYRDRFLSLLG